MKSSILIIGVFLLATAFGLLLIFKSDNTGGTEGGKLNAAALENVLSVDEEAALHRTATSGVKAPALPTTFIIDKDGTVLDTFHLIEPMEFESKLDMLTEGR